MQVHEINEELPLVDQIREKLRLFQPDNDWKNLFEYYDLDGDCRMGLDEFGLLLRRDIGMRVHQINDDEIEQVFKDIDTKQSGDVDADEFAAWVVLETVEAQWVKVRSALKSKGDKGLSQLLIEPVTGGSTVDFNSCNVYGNSAYSVRLLPLDFLDPIPMALMGCLLTR